LKIFLGNGNGTFTASSVIPMIEGVRVIAADFNGDGLPDLAISNEFSNTLSVLIGKGDGTFSQTNVTVPTNFAPFSMAAGDFNNDGKLDLAVASTSGGTASIFIGNGDGTLTSTTSLATNGYLASIVAADFNGDGKIDLAVGNATNLDGGPSTVQIFSGNGDGTFTSQGPGLPMTGDPVSMSVADFNRDGVADVAVASYQSAGGIQLFLGKGDGTFSSLFQSLASSASYASEFAIADLNGDGTPDLAVSQFGSIALMTTMPMETASTTATSILLPAVGHHIVDAVYAGDSNYTSSTSATVSLLGTPAASVNTLAITVAGVSQSTVAAQTPVTLTATVKVGGSPLTSGAVNFCDATSNLCTDIHLIGAAQLQTNGTASFTYIPGSGRHTYKAVLQQSVIAAASSSNAVTLTVNPSAKVIYPTTATIAQSGTVNNYTLTATVSEAGNVTPPTGNVSFLDSSYANSALATVPLGPGTPGVVFKVGSSVAIPSGAASSLAVGDFNGDGIPDVAAVNTNAMTVTILLGNGDGTFTAKGVLTIPGYANTVLTADFNGDGKLDLAVSYVNSSNPSTDFVTILLGNGDGTFTAVPSPIAVTGGLVAAADLNADGRIDLVVCGPVSESGSTVILLGNGDGTFTKSPSTTFGNVLAVADLNGDRIPDLITVGSSGVIASLGNGDGTFRSGGSLPASSVGYPVATVGDFNGDGIPDVALMPTSYSAATLFLGKGDGTFTAMPSGSNFAVNEPEAIAATDFNGDGKLDLVITNGNSYSNLQNPDLIVLLGNGDGTFNTVPGDIQLASTGPLAVVDLTGSGTSDVVVGTASGVSAMLTQPTLTYTASATGISPPGPAPHLVDATYPGDGNYSASTSATTSLSVQVVTPVVSPATGSYTSQSAITITDSTPGATIYYETTTNAYAYSSYLPYTGPIPIYNNNPVFITAYATENGYQQSATANANYTFNLPVAPPPVFSVAAGEYPTTQTVTISDSAPGTSILYTTNGLAPTSSSQLYTGPIVVASSETLNAMAAGGGYSASTPVDAQYLISTSSVNLIYTVAGSSSALGRQGNGGPATVASFTLPFGTVADSAGNLYISDSSNSIVRKVDATSGIATIYAGTGSPGDTGDGGPAEQATLSYPMGLAIDSGGNLYIADYSNHAIRMVSASTGNISTVAGSPTATAVGDGGPATSAQLFPNAVAVDRGGNLYIASADKRIRKVTAATGIITTVAGNGNYGYFGDGGLATSATVSDPMGVAVDSAGDLLIADTSNNVVREVSAATGIITTVAGPGSPNTIPYHYSGDGGPARSAALLSPYAVAFDSSGNIVIADTGNDAIRRVDATTGIINTIAGSPTLCTTMSGDGGPAFGASLCSPTSVALDTNGNLFVTEQGARRVRKITAPAPPPTATAASPVFSLQPGSYLSTQTVSITDATPGAAIYITTDGSAPTTLSPQYHGALNVTATATLKAVAVAPGYLVSPVSAAAYTILTPPSALINTIAGTGVAGSFSFGTAATSQQLQQPQSLAMDGSGNLYISDPPNLTVWKLTPSGTISAAAGNYFLAGVAVDNAGNIYMSDSYDNEVLVTSPQTGTTSIVAGTGQPSYAPRYGDGGPASFATLSSPAGLAVDSAGNLYIADTGHYEIRMVAAQTGIITTVAGGGSLGDNSPATSAFIGRPVDVAFDSKGNMYIAETGKVHMVTASSGNVTTIAGDGHVGNNGDGGPALAADIDPTAVRVDAAGNVYIANFPNEVRVIPADSSTIMAFAGDGLTGYSGDSGSASMAELSNPDGLAADPSGNLYISDGGNSRIRKITFPTSAPTPTFSLAAGTYVNTQTVTIAETIPGATIYYTRDGSPPTPASSVYSAPISLSASTTLRAIAVAAGYTTSTVNSAAYVIQPPVVPSITWSTPAPILFGTPLGAAQLNATASVPGTFAYTPNTGTTLPAGSDTLAVTFIPTDLVNYTTATAQVSITVNLPVPVLSSISPPLSAAGGATFTITATGTGFTNGAVLNWGSSTLTTQFVSAAQLTAQVPAADIANVGIVSIAVQNPGSTGTTSNSLQFDVDSASVAAPVFTASTNTVAHGSSASYPVSLPSSATNISVQCLNLPSGATCSYSSASSSLTITTSPTTAAGTYLVTVVFTETLPGAASGFIFIPLLLLPLAAAKRNRRRHQLWLACLAGIAITLAGTTIGCGGASGAGSSTPPQTHVVTSASTVTLVVQ
jgi:sugar lactone lactonase YvrE